MIARRIIAGLGIGALAAAGLAVAPALRAQEGGGVHEVKRTPAIIGSGIGTFTPAAADPKLAALLERGGLSGSGFRFTPSDTKRKGRDSVTVAVRARSSRAARAAERSAGATSAAPPQVSLAPIAYNLGVSVGWKRFALSGDVARVDLGELPGSRESVGVGISYTGKRFSGRVKAGADRPIGDQPVLIAQDPSYSIDLGGSYSVTHNLDVTAGVRYKREEERARLPRLAADDRRDSQAVYIGTAFRF